jgi:hypothetical protein
MQPPIKHMIAHITAARKARKVDSPYPNNLGGYGLDEVTSRDFMVPEIGPMEF